MTKQVAQSLAIDTQEALRLLGMLPSDATLDAVDDDEMSGRRPCPLPDFTLNDVRALRALLAAKGADSFDVRLWDSQWINAVNHDNAYRDWSKEDAIDHAVRMTEKYMRKNVTEWKWPPSREDSAFVELENCTPPLRDAEKEKGNG